MEEWKRKVHIWGTQSCCCVPEQLVHFYLSKTVKAGTAEKPQCVPWANLHILQLCSIVTGLDAFQTELSSTLEWKALFHDMQCSYPAQLTSLLPQHYEMAVVSWWGVHRVLGHTTPTQSCRTKGLWGQDFAGTPPCVLRQGWLLLSSGTW